MLGDPTLCAAILAAFRAQAGPGSALRVLDHAPLQGTGSAEHAVSVRGTPLEVGGKAILLKADGAYVLAAYSAARRLHSNTLRKALGVRRMRFATRDELAQQTGLVPGCVPPVGQPLLPFPLYADPSLTHNEVIAFTPGLLTRSVVAPVALWLAVARPTIVAFTVAPGE